MPTRNGVINISLYVKKENSYTKYCADKNGNLICSKSGTKDDIITDGITDEFDAVYDSDSFLHFFIQTVNGGMIYLKFDGSVWKKYTVFQSRYGRQKISKVRLTYTPKYLCAFYIMEHDGRYMLIKHIFNSGELTIEPSVVDYTDSRKDFCICSDTDNRIHLFYRNGLGERKEKIYGENCNEIKLEKRAFDGDIFAFNAVNDGKDIYIAYTTRRKNYTALIFENYAKADSEKVITFGIARNCIPRIYAANKNIVTEWFDGGNVYYSESKDGGLSFTKPKRINSYMSFDKLRLPGQKCGIICNECAFDKSGKICIEPGILHKSDYENKEVNNMTYAEKYLHEHAHPFEKSSFDVYERIKNIDKNIKFITESVENIGRTLDKIIEIKRNAEKNDFIVPQKSETVKSDDIGEINDENMKLFESMSIDDAIPKSEIPENQKYVMEDISDGQQQ